jgi:hypothetical protein
VIRVVFLLSLLLVTSAVLGIPGGLSSSSTFACHRLSESRERTVLPPSLSFCRPPLSGGFCNLVYSMTLSGPS